MNFSIFIEIPQIYTYTNSKLSDACMRENMLQWEQFYSLPFEFSTQLNHNKFISIDLLMHLEYLENVDVKCPQRGEIIPAVLLFQLERSSIEMYLDIENKTIFFDEYVMKKKIGLFIFHHMIGILDSEDFFFKFSSVCGPTFINDSKIYINFPGKV